jgi:hypothetical protein
MVAKRGRSTGFTTGVGYRLISDPLRRARRAAMWKWAMKGNYAGGGQVKGEVLMVKTNANR